MTLHRSNASVSTYMNKSGGQDNTRSELLQDDEDNILL